jgi:mono/diheme cytochrome c family protein
MSIGRIVRWAALVVVVLVAGGFFAFLYFIPPLTSLPPETFIEPARTGTPSVDSGLEPARRLLAERGRYIVLTSDCAGCHVPAGAQGPDWAMSLAGGMKFTLPDGTYVSRNLTSDRETGIGSRSDEELARVLRSGLFHTGRLMRHRAMPWAISSNWTEDDLQAVIAYLRTLKPVRHVVPDPDPSVKAGSGLVELDYGGQDYGKK